MAELAKASSDLLTLLLLQPFVLLSSVEQLLSAGADPKIRNSANEKPEDLLLGSAKESEKGQEVRRMLRDAEAESTFASKGDVVDGESRLHGVGRVRGCTLHVARGG
jgi:hypothetical protein